ncbi:MULTISPECIES: MmgE/PrpD family protein [unclassified Caballeronia]|uniref:MmgE/PrpD family protein n=1 Tax=unclassified Caballeronia TaxID=2646786 RepID=UPI0028557CF9|nr:MULTISPECIES: MmgE/PrpD family protein [unclassified Caballeronia]MDR5752416.1 MmgE/PrpD family protein [Caballeronia sp. LZ024]MDR5845222.1 MmgE/PrpD family protein [Caballeronia sp. LZ031]
MTKQFQQEWPQRPASACMNIGRRNALNGICKIMAAAAIPLAVATDAIAQVDAQTASAATSSASPNEKSAAEMPVSEVMTRLSSYISLAHVRPLPPDVMEGAKWALLDGFAAMVSGAQLPGGRAAIRFARESGGASISTVIGSQIKCDPVTAALANGTMGHSDETDDVLVGPWHPGCNVIPSALALGEKFGISGVHFLRAIAVGYDIGSRVMKATGVKMDFRAPTNSMGGTWGAAAAAICAAGLNAEKTRWALAYTAQQCSGIDDFRRDPRHIEKGFMNGGMGARSGVTSALLVLSGFDGVNDIMSGDVSFFSAYRETANPAHLVDKLGEDYYVTHAIYKHWPTGLPISAPLDALRDLLKRGPIDPKQIRDIEVSYWSPGSITDNSGPPDVNMQHAVALMLADGRLTFKSIHDYTRLKDPEVVRLRSMIKIAPRAGDVESIIGSSGKQHSTAPAVKITMSDGTQLLQEAITPGPGTPKSPYTREWMVRKARSLIMPVFGRAQTEKLIETILGLENHQDIRVLGPLLRANADQLPRLSDWPMEG